MEGTANKILLALGFVCLVATGYMMLAVKNQVQNLKKDLRSLYGDIAENKEEIHVLHAEWEYLNAPDRLKALAERYLTLDSAAAAQLHSGISALGSGYILNAGRQPEGKDVASVSPVRKPVHYSYARGKGHE
jgi:hypothetical protein